MLYCLAILVTFFESSSEHDGLTQPRIVGGSMLEIEQIPFLVPIFTNNSFNCGGSLIAPKFVLSASHCTAGSNFTVRVGSTYLDSGGIMIKISRIIYHDMPIKPIEHDIAIFELAEAALDKGVPASVVKIWDRGDIPIGSIGGVAGWGKTSENGTQSSRLLFAKIPVVDIENCKKVYKTVGMPIKEAHFCAGLKEGGVDVCQGDSGGPFLLNGMLAGITSFGFGCARRDVPGVYVEVSKYAEWIKNNTGSFDHENQ